MIGGIGSVFFFSKIQNTPVETAQESYKIKNNHSPKETYLHLSGNSHFVIQKKRSNRGDFRNTRKPYNKTD